MMILEWIGTGFIISAQVCRTFPKHIVKSLSLGLIGSTALLLYSLITGQYGFVTINVISIVTNIIAIRQWKKVNNDTKRRTR